MSVLDEIKAHGADMELKGVNFLDADGKYCSISMSECVTVQVMFIDGKEFELPYNEFFKLNDFKFKLRSSTNDS